MKFQTFLVAGLLALGVSLAADESTSRDVNWKIRREATENSQIMKTLHVLTDGTGRWTKRRLEEAIASAGSSRIALARPLPVYILYWTAFADPDGAVQFRYDVYGRDRRLADMLASRVEALTPTGPGRVRGCPPAR